MPGCSWNGKSTLSGCPKLMLALCSVIIAWSHAVTYIYILYYEAVYWARTSEKNNNLRPKFSRPNLRVVLHFYEKDASRGKRNHLLLWLSSFISGPFRLRQLRQMHRYVAFVLRNPSKLVIMTPWLRWIHFSDGRMSPLICLLMKMNVDK